MVEILTAEDGVDEPALCVEFFLGEEGRLGGGNGCAPQSPESYVSLAGHYWSDAPDIVAMFGAVERPAVSARVYLDDGRTMPLEILRSTKDEAFGWYVFFPPPFEEGRVVAFDADGNRVGSEPLCFPIRAGGFSMEPLENGNGLCSR